MHNERNFIIINLIMLRAVQVQFSPMEQKVQVSPTIPYPALLRGFTGRLVYP